MRQAQLLGHHQRIGDTEYLATPGSLLWSILNDSRLPANAGDNR